MKPLNHPIEYLALICDQLRAEFPSASGYVVDMAGRAAISPRRSPAQIIPIQPYLEAKELRSDPLDLSNFS